MRGLLPVLLFAFSGCLASITSIVIPPDIILGDPFTIVITGTLEGVKPGIAGVVLQLPSGIRVDQALCYARQGRKRLRRSVEVEERYEAEEGHYVAAFVDSIAASSAAPETVRVILTAVAEQVGVCTVKAIAGAADRAAGVDGWKSTDPKKQYAFSLLADPAYSVTTRVREALPSGQSALQFDGYKSYLFLPVAEGCSLALDSSFTFECWFATTGLREVLAGTRSDDFMTAFAFELMIDEQGSMVLCTADGGREKRTSQERFVADGRWHHVAVVYASDTRTMHLHLEGLPVDSLSIGYAGGPPPQGLTIASRRGRRLFFTGLIDEIRLWSVARTARELQATRIVPLTGAEAFLCALYSFEKTSGGYVLNGSPRSGMDGVAYNRPRLVPSTAPLDVEYKTFRADVREDSVIISWVTLDEGPVLRYEIEKRLESGSFFVIARRDPVKAGTKQGEYSIAAPRSRNEVCFYRLKQVNEDGTIQLSEELPVGAESVHNFTLEQNAPNPFFPLTVITYHLREPAHVTLTVYDYLGRLVETLLDQRQPPGTHTVEFNGTDLPSGIYFYKLRTAAGSETRKMLLSQ